MTSSCGFLRSSKSIGLNSSKRTSTSTMSVTRPADLTRGFRTVMERRVAAFLLCLLSGAVSSVPVHAGGGEDVVSACHGLVRVQFKRKVSAVVYQDKLIPEASVLEVSEFPGIIADPRGYVVSYIGSAWRIWVPVSLRSRSSCPTGRSRLQTLSGLTSGYHSPFCVHGHWANGRSSSVVWRMQRA